MPSGSKRRRWRKSGYDCPETTSTILPSELIPDWQYCHFVPGSNCSGFAAKWGIRSASLLAALDSCGVASAMPEVCVNRCRSVSLAGFPSGVLRLASSGRYFDTGSSTESLPSSWSIKMAVAVTGLVIEAIQKRLSGRIGVLAATSASPTLSRLRTLSLSATSVTAPAMVWFSTNGRRASAIFLAGGWAWAGRQIKAASVPAVTNCMQKTFMVGSFWQGSGLRWAIPKA